MEKFIPKGFKPYLTTKNVPAFILFLGLFISLIQLFRKYVLRHGYDITFTTNIKSFISGHTIFLGIIGLCIITILVTSKLLYGYKFNDVKSLFLKIVDKKHIKKYVIGYLLIFFLIFTYLAFKKHTNLLSALFDFGLEHQVIWNTSKGRLFASGAEVSNYLGDHFSPIIILSSIIYAIFPTALTVFATQTMCVVMGALGIFFIAKKALKNEYLAFLWMVMFSIYFGNFGILMFDYHPISWVIPLLIWGIYFWTYTKRYKTAFLLFFLATLCKEDVGIFIGMFGIYSLIKKDKKGLFLILYGFAITLVSMFVIIPAIRGEASDTLARYSELGGTPSEIIKTLITKPKFMFDYLVTDMKISYLMKLFIPVGFLFLFSPFAAILFLPSLLLNLLTNSEYQNSGIYHYDTLTTVGIFFASILGMKNLMLNKRFFIQYKSLYLRFTLFLLLIFSGLFFLGNPVWKYVYLKNDRVQDYKYLMDLKKRIPTDAVLSVTNAAGAHFGDREKLQLFYPTWIVYKEAPEYIIADKIDVYDSSFFAHIESKKADGYNLVEENDSFIVLFRKR